MSNYKKYEEIKQYLRTLNLTHEEYDRIIKTVAEVLEI